MVVQAACQQYGEFFRFKHVDDAGNGSGIIAFNDIGFKTGVRPFALRGDMNRKIMPAANTIGGKTIGFKHMVIGIHLGEVPAKTAAFQDLASSQTITLKINLGCRRI